MGKILVIDDEKDIREITARLLRGEGYEVFEAVDGLVGIQLIEEKKPDLVICDLLMEKMEGKEVVEYIKINHLTIKTIIQSAAHGVEEEVLATGCDVFMEKPFDFSDLIKKVKLLLRDDDPFYLGTCR